MFFAKNNTKKIEFVQFYFYCSVLMIMCEVWCIEFTTETKYKFVAVPSKKYMEF